MLSFDIDNRSSWEKIKDSGLPAVIYGMGNGADKVINEFERLGIPVLGITASDDFVRGQNFRGFTVKKLSDFSEDFILCPAFGSSIPSVIEHFKNLLKEYRIIVPVVPVYGDNIFNRDFVEENEEKINEAHKLFHGKSKEIFEGCVNFLFGGELSVLFDITTEKSEIFQSFLKLSGNDSYLDLGAYRGDTVEEFLSYSGGNHNGIIAVEPDEKTYKKMCENLKSISNLTPVCKAISDINGEISFASSAGRQSSISEKGKTKESITIDKLCHENGVSYIKMDVEGAELKAIFGGKNTISKYRPKLNIALYHRSEDIFEIPLEISKICPEYSMEIRRHPYIPCWDMNLYCV